MKTPAAERNLYCVGGVCFVLTVCIALLARLDWDSAAIRVESAAAMRAARSEGFVQDTVEYKQEEEALLQKAADLEVFNAEMIGQKKHMIEPKEEGSRLCAELHRPPVYLPVWQAKSPPKEPHAPRPC